MQLYKALIPDYIQGKYANQDTVINHFTAGGTLSGAIETLKKPDTINVHVCVDTDGKPYQTMPFDKWAYASGVNWVKDPQGNTMYWCKRSFHVEYVCYGILDRYMDGDQELWLPWTMEKHKAVPIEKTVMCEAYGAWKKTRYTLLTTAQYDTMHKLSEMFNDIRDIRYEITHADVNNRKCDFPPDYPGIIRVPQDFYRLYRKQWLDFSDPGDPNMILPGQEPKYTKAQIQARINYLIKYKGWDDEELNRLIKYRDSHK